MMIRMTRRSWTTDYRDLGDDPDVVSSHAQDDLGRAHRHLNKPLTSQDDAELRQTAAAILKARVGLQAVSVGIAIESRRRGESARQTGMMLGTTAGTVRQWEIEIDAQNAQDDAEKSA